MATITSQNVAGRLDALHVANTIVRYEPRETVFTQGDRSAAVMYIRNGSVKLTVTSQTGRTAVVAVLRAGSFFGEAVLAGQRRRSCSADTVMDSTIASVKTSDMRKSLSEQPMLADCFLSHLLARNVHIESNLISQLFNRSEKGLARILLLLANFDAHYLLRAPLPMISRKLLAEASGMSRPRVDVLMSKFRKLGFIERVAGGLQVHRSLLSVVTQE